MINVTQAGAVVCSSLALALAGLADAGTAASAASTSAASAVPARGVAVAGADPATDLAFTPAIRANAIVAAQSKASAIAKSLGLGAGERLVVRDVVRDADGTLHTRYDRSLGGLRVIGGDLVVHQSAAGKLQSAEFATTDPLTVVTDGATPVPAAKAASVATGAVAAKAASAEAPEKVVWAVSGTPRLAWLVRVDTVDDAGFPRPMAVVVDARTGAEIQSWDLNQTAEGRGKSLYGGTVSINTVRSGDRYLLRDDLRGGTVTVDARNQTDRNGQVVAGSVFTDADNTWGDGTAANRQTAAVDVAYGVAETWDYYLETFNRRGIAADGKGTKSRVHYGRDYDNAFWSDQCFCMTFGDGGKMFKPLVSLDVTGHELTHGVTARTAALAYYGDAGGLNEATSDIFGTMVEFSANNPQNPGDYILGEGMMKPGQGEFLRRMDDPAADGDSYSCWTPTMGLDDVHFTSGPGNHFFYLLAEGSGAKVINGIDHNSPVCDGAAAVDGVGRDAAADIWYRALTRYFLSTTGYLDARDATIRAAIDLYGKGSAECDQVAKAWDGVAVPSQFWTCLGATGAGPNLFGDGDGSGFEPPNDTWLSRGRATVSDSTRVGTPRRGQWFGIIGNRGADSAGSLSTMITVPDVARSELRFWMAIGVSKHRAADGSIEPTAAGTVDVYFEGEPLAHFDEANANSTYQPWQIKLDAFRGQTGELTIVGQEFAPPDGFFKAMFDDFAIVER